MTRREMVLAVCLAASVAANLVAWLRQAPPPPPPGAVAGPPDGEAAARRRLMAGLRADLDLHGAGGGRHLEPETVRHMRRRLAELEAEEAALRAGSPAATR
jgi:hypothetical protein